MAKEKDPIRSGDREMPEKLFKNVKYYLIGNIDSHVEDLLKKGGGKRDHYLSEMVSYVIADNTSEADYSEAKELFELPVVTSRWVILSEKCGCLLPIDGFSPETNQIFSNVVACPSQIAAADRHVLWGLITYHGGICQKEFNKKVTHLICTKISGPKYECAMRHQEQVKVVTPDWLTDCLKEKKMIDELKYHPRFLILEPPKREPSPEPVVEPLAAPPMFMPTPGVAIRYPLSNSPRFPSPGHAKPGMVPRAENMYAKEMLAKRINSRIQQSIRPGENVEGMFPDMPPFMRPVMPMGMPRPRGSARGGQAFRPTSPRTLKNITNNAENKPPKSPRSPRSPARGSAKISQLMSTLGRSPRGVSPGRHPAFAQLHFANRPPGLSQMPVYYGHDPTETVPEDLCLLGCVFYITDYQKCLEAEDLSYWKQVVEGHGGQVDDSYSNRVTHVLCEHQRSDVFNLALRDGKRVVTAHWLNDCLLKKKLFPPWMALHFPTKYSSKEKICANQMICVTNFEGEERARLKHMITAIGAKYTGYMTNANSVLIAKKLYGTKYEKAIEWQIPVVNVQWLNDLLLGCMDALKKRISPRYQQFNLGDEFKMDIPRVAYLMEGWQIPIKIPKETWKRFVPSQLMKRSSCSQDTLLGQKRKADELDQPPGKKFRTDDVDSMQLNGEGIPVVLITGIPRIQAVWLAKQVSALGGRVVSTAKGCTHIVACSVARTVKFLTALSIVKYVVTPAWIERSLQEAKFLDESDFALKDTQVEADFSFNLQESLKRAREKPLFQELTFHITPGVVTPNRKSLREMIANAGGTIVDKRPSARNIANKKDSHGNPAIVVITCEDDFYLCLDLVKRNIGVYNAEFVMTGIMRQEIDYKCYLIK